MNVTLYATALIVACGTIVYLYPITATRLSTTEIAIARHAKGLETLTMMLHELTTASTRLHEELKPILAYASVRTAGARKSTRSSLDHPRSDRDYEPLHRAKSI